MSNWYEYPTNYSNGESVDGPGSMFMKYPSFILNNSFSYGIVSIIFIMAFALSMILGSRKALLTAGFFAFIFSVYFVKLGTINIIVPIVLVFIMILGAIGSKSETSY